jgi:F-box protein 21
MYPSLIDLPNEILFQILIYVPPNLTPAILLTSRRFNDVADPRLWRFHCQTQYRYWSQDHGLKKALLDNSDSVEWKKVFSERYNKDKKISDYIDSIVASQSGRIEKAERIVSFGYDAKDTLLRHINTPDDADDVLARRYR